MKRLTKKYPNGFITLDASAFPQTQETIDCEIRNHDFVKAAVEKLYEHEERNPTRFSDDDIERVARRLCVDVFHTVELINNFDRGIGDIDDIVDLIEDDEGKL